VLKSSILAERVSADLYAIRAQGGDFPRDADDYINEWVEKRYLVREYLERDDEESLWLSVSVIDAIRFIESLANPQSSVTESRLSILIQALGQLSLDSDKDAARRLDTLLKERDQLNARIEAIERGEVNVISDLEATDRIRDILALGLGLAEDFSRVQENYKVIQQNLRDKMLQSMEPVDNILDRVFLELDRLHETEAGRAFDAFYELLKDGIQLKFFEKSMDIIYQAEFFQLLTWGERHFLRHFIKVLFDESVKVNKITNRFSDGLFSLLKSRDFKERRRISAELKESLKTASILSSHIPASRPINFHLEMSTTALDSVSRLTLLDYLPDDTPQPIRRAENRDLDLATVLSSIQGDEIDFDTLLANVLSVLELLPKASIGDVLYHFPATEGLGSVVGLMHLAQRYGEREEHSETVSWLGMDEKQRSATIDKWYFYREKMAQLSL
jgi:hypothetical protein